MCTTATYSSKWDQWWMPKEGTEITYYQFMRKDEVALHSVMFPTCLFVTERNYTFVNHIMTTGLFVLLNLILLKAQFFYFFFIHFELIFI